MTLARETQQTEWLELFRDLEQHAPCAWQLKQWLLGGEIKSDAALFPLDSNSGEIVANLFGESGYFADIEQFWML